MSESEQLPQAEAWADLKCAGCSLTVNGKAMILGGLPDPPHGEGCLIPAGGHVEWEIVGQHYSIDDRDVDQETWLAEVQRQTAMLTPKPA